MAELPAVEVGDEIGWDLLPDGDVLIVREVDNGVIYAQRGHAEHFAFTSSITPPPYKIKPTPDKDA